MAPCRSLNTALPRAAISDGQPCAAEATRTSRSKRRRCRDRRVAVRHAQKNSVAIQRVCGGSFHRTLGATASPVQAERPSCGGADIGFGEAFTCKSEGPQEDTAEPVPFGMRRLEDKLNQVVSFLSSNIMLNPCWSDEWHDLPMDRSRNSSSFNAMAPAFEPGGQEPAITPVESYVSFKNWRPADADVFAVGSTLHSELVHVAALHVQTWYRALQSTEGSFHTDDDEEMLFTKEQVQAVIAHTREEFEKKLQDAMDLKNELLQENYERSEALASFLTIQLNSVFVGRVKLHEEVKGLGNSGLVEGTRIITDGLHDPNKNHVLGKLLLYDAMKERWQVKLDGTDRPVKIKAQDIRPLRE